MKQLIAKTILTGLLGYLVGAQTARTLEYTPTPRWLRILLAAFLGGLLGILLAAFLGGLLGWSISVIT